MTDLVLHVKLTKATDENRNRGGAVALLTDADLRERLCTGAVWTDVNKLFISPYSEECMTPIGYDLRVGAFRPRIGRVRRFGSDRGYILKEGNSFYIGPGETFLITTLETVGMPQNFAVSGLLVSMVSNVKKGLSLDTTSIDADWSGTLAVYVYNRTRTKIELKYGDRICTAVFFLNSSPASKGSGYRKERTNDLLEEWSSSGKGILVRKIALYTAPLLVLFVVAIIGFQVYGNASGASAMVAIGAAFIAWIAFVRNDLKR